MRPGTIKRHAAGGLAVLAIASAAQLTGAAAQPAPPPSGNPVVIKAPEPLFFTGLPTELTIDAPDALFFTGQPTELTIDAPDALVFTGQPTELTVDASDALVFTGQVAGELTIDAADTLVFTGQPTELTIKATEALTFVGQTPTVVTSNWDTSYGLMRGLVPEAGGQIQATYEDGQSRIAGNMIGAYELVGYWYEPDSANRCDTKRGGTYYWGRLRFEFNTAATSSLPGAYQGFDGVWGYCNDAPENVWTGERILVPASSASGG